MEPELTRRLRQQRLIAEFGVFALREPALQPALDRAAHCVVEGLGCPFAKVLEHLPAENRLLVRAGVGWRPGVVGTATVGGDLESPAGYALHTGQPVLSNHLDGESRFRTPALMAEHGVRRAINVVVRGDGASFGVLEADSTDRGEFCADDIHFLQALANTLAVAIEREAARREAGRQQELLLREIHHRVKNSLQLVQSTLSLQARFEAEPARTHLEEAAARVKTIAAVHDRLYRGSSLGEIEMSVYLEGLIADLRASLADTAQGCGIDLVGADRDTWPADDAPAFGLVVTELITNALKYGKGTVRVRFRRLERAAELSVEDNGPGFPPDFDPRCSRGLGMRVVAALAKPPRAAVEIDRAAPGGRVVVRFNRES
ncbi:histidine kinase dimerization/phosphoacceptor domain -containing protein [Roseicella sp. DB1501]|uniref:sensor histidine kinase n=1 Tax=Roseicella sp. DB1501 TaxID=2730925 RepID=UPI001490E974|nr:GAF domain-containing protein [Roseicella sp. DB1501]